MVSEHYKTLKGANFTVLNKAHEDFMDAYGYALTCVKMRIPKAVVVSKKDHSFCCPHCKNDMVGYKDNFCNHCGKALSWG